MSGYASIYGSEGDDMLGPLVENQNNYIEARGGNDYILAKGGEDLVLGGSGDDTIIGGAGDDTMTGGTGADTFVFDGDNFGHDLIIDFAIGTDTLQIVSGINGTGIASASDVAAFVTDDGSGNAVITLGSDTITLQGLSVTDVQNNIDSIVSVV